MNRDFEAIPPQSAGDQKVEEYVQRINNGEDANKVKEGLPDVFKDALEKRLNQENPVESPSDNKVDESLPPQYEGMSAEAIDFIWTIPEYTDPEKTKAEKLKKELVLKKLLDQESKEEHKENVRSNDLEEAEKIKQDLGVSQANTPENPQGDPFKEFRVKNGESTDDWFWYEYNNEEAKRLKNSGEFEWGKERIYFDIKFEDAQKLRDIIFKIAGENKIAIGFKHLDLDKTSKLNIDGNETRFVANFASLEETQRFFKLLQDSDDYKNLTTDREMDYHGIRLDKIAEYASGFREKRGALARMVNAELSPNGNYEYVSPLSGKHVSLSPEQHAGYKQQYDKLSEQIKIIEESWKKSSES